VTSHHTSARFHRLSVLNGRRPYIALCPCCQLPAAECSRNRANTWQIFCEACIVRLFVRRQEQLWPVVGLGTGLLLEGADAVAEAHRHRMALGASAADPSLWTVVVSRDGKARRTFRYKLACVLCGDRSAMRLSLDRKERPTAYCEACRARGFLVRGESAVAMVGLSEWMLREQAPGSSSGPWWNAREQGRLAMEAWRGPAAYQSSPGEAGKTAGVEVEVQ